MSACSCETGADRDGGLADATFGPDATFMCVTEESMACVGNRHFSCTRDGEFLSSDIDDCDLRTDGHNLCVRGLGCRICRPEETFCLGTDVAMCNGDGTASSVIEECDVENGFVCDLGRCRNLCELALENRSYQGCEFFGVDLDNAALTALNNASGQQYSIVVSNPGTLATEIVVEINRAAPGEAPVLEELERLNLLPGDLEILNLPRREVDGSSSMAGCSASTDCDGTESCWCSGGVVIEDPPPVGDTHTGCLCRLTGTTDGVDDGTDSAITSNAYRVSSVFPIIAYQFNPLDNVGVFSNDASLLLPSSAIGRRYTVVGWPQTIAHSATNPNEDFDPSSDDEDLRAFLTITGTAPSTHVTITLSPQVRAVVPVGRPTGEPFWLADEVHEFDIGPFDVINLETQGFNADFTGTLIETTQPVGVFVGSEASDAPRFDIVANRQCCADHLEEQLFPDDTLGVHFFIGRMPPRSVALNAAFLDPTMDSVGEFNEREYIRIVAVAPDMTRVETTLDAPDNEVFLAQGESIILTADRDFEIVSDRAIAVLQVLPSQGATGIEYVYPGGDPAIIAVPPVEQYREEYVFLTPNLYAFDFVVIEAPAAATVFLDERPLDEWIREGHCHPAAADGIARRMDDPPALDLVYRCQLSYPDVVGPREPVEPGIQNDGYHTVRANEPVGLIVYGFDAYVSYAYAGGLNLEVIR